MDNLYGENQEGVSVAGFEVPRSPDSSYNNPYPGNEDEAKDPPIVPPHLHHTLLSFPTSRDESDSARGNRRNLSECFANFPLVSCLLVPKEERTWENFLIPSKPIEPEMSAKRQKRALVIHPLPPRGVWSVPGVGSSSRRSSPAATVLPDALVTPTVSAPGSAALSAGSTNVVHFEMPSSSSIFGDDSYVPQVLSRIAGSGDDTRVFEMGAARALDWIEARAYQAAACANLTKGLITEKDRQLAEWAEKPAALQSCYDAIAVKMTELELEHGKCLAESDAYAERSAMLARGQVINEVAQGRHHTWDMAGELARWKKFKREEGIPDEEEPSDAA